LEPVTHFLTGACLARAGFNRKSALATATMTLAAEAPDLDVLGSFKDPVFGFAHHRGFTHSFLGLFLTSALVVGFIYLIWRLRGRKIKNPKLPPRWGLLFLFAYIAGLTHILLDYTNNYGVRPFWPFSEKWYSADLVFIVDPLMLAILVGGLVLPLFSSLLDSEFGVRPKDKTPQGRLSASLALLAIVAMWCGRAYEHHLAVNQLKAQSYEGAEPLRASAFPNWWSPFDWAGVVETQNFFATMDVNTLTEEVAPSGDIQIYHKPEETPVTLTAKKSYLGQVYLDWAQYPITETERIDPPDSGYIVHFQDLRFASPRIRGRSPLTCSVQLDNSLHVIAESVGSRTRKLASQNQQ
jgi:inner membrane protein